MDQQPQLESSSHAFMSEQHEALVHWRHAVSVEEGGQVAPELVAPPPPAVALPDVALPPPHAAAIEAATTSTEPETLRSVPLFIGPPRDQPKRIRPAASTGVRRGHLPRGP